MDALERLCQSAWDSMPKAGGTMSMTRRASWGAAIASFAAFFCIYVGTALAVEVKLATSQGSDSFISLLRSSKPLQQAGVKIVIVPMTKDEDVLDALIKGRADLGLFDLNALSKRKFKNQPELFSVFTRPFLFNSASEIVDVQNTPIGDAVLADVARVGIFPLSYWNRGLSQIWTRQPVRSAEHFKGLIVGANSGGASDQYRDVYFYSLGAKPTRLAPTMMAEAFEKGRVGAAVYEPSDSSSSDWQNRDFGFTIYATDFQPRVGVFASSRDHWDNLSEENKIAWNKAVEEVSKLSANQIKLTDSSLRKNPSHIFSASMDNRALARAVATSNQSSWRLDEDFRLIDDARAFVAGDQAVKKKPN
jgi:TRAP-type C4-dicarboxylate transport system substrate-binding protein